MQALLSQRNLPANSQRKYAISALLPGGPASGAAPVVGPMPMELGDASLLSPSPADQGEPEKKKKKKKKKKKDAP